jgi:homoserine O-acetyltransferase
VPAATALKFVGLERALVLGSSTDILFPPAQQHGLASILKSAGTKTTYQNLITLKGHDAFLAKNGPFAKPIADFCQALANTLNRPEIRSFSQ